MRKAVFESVAGTIALIGSGFATVEAMSYPGESGMMPKGVSMAMVLLSVLWLIQSVRMLRQPDGPILEITAQQKRNAVILAIGGLALLFGMNFIGFFTTAAILVPVLCYLVGYRNIKALALATVLFIVMLVAVFRQLLSVPLPPELLLTLFGG